MRRKSNPTDWEGIFGVLELLVYGLRAIGKLVLFIISFFE